MSASAVAVRTSVAEPQMVVVMPTSPASTPPDGVADRDEHERAEGVVGGHPGEPVSGHVLLQRGAPLHTELF
jgi:hypothetical protein